MAYHHVDLILEGNAVLREEEERKRQKQALVEPIKEAVYATFLCLRTFRETCRAFESPDFFRGAFGPFLCPHTFKTFRYDGDIK
jgi:hypothetical protein